VAASPAPVTGWSHSTRVRPLKTGGLSNKHRLCRACQKHARFVRKTHRRAALRAVLAAGGLHIQRATAEASRKAVTQSRCPSVSGTPTPRALLIIANAASGSSPKQTSAHAAMREERPMPARQCTATASPSPILAATARASATVSHNSAGTARSGMGNEMNSIPCCRQRSASRPSPSSLTSSDSRRLTTMSIPSARHPEISSSSQSPARGRAMIANRPAVGRTIQ
jgi:hypothetical protein